MAYVPSSSVIKYEKKDRVAWVTLNRPEAMNALNTEIRIAITEAMGEVERDDDVLVAVLIGEGGRAFCAGNDLKEQTQLDTAAGGAGSRNTPSGSQAVYECLKPTIAAIDGYALAGGMQRLPRQIGMKNAMGMMLTGRHVGAEEAKELGIVNEVVTQADLMDTARKWAIDIEACSPMSIRATKQVRSEERR